MIQPAAACGNTLSDKAFGNFPEDSTQVLFTVSDLNRLWAELRADSSELKLVKNGMNVEITPLTVKKFTKAKSFTFHASSTKPAAKVSSGSNWKILPVLSTAVNLSLAGSVWFPNAAVLSFPVRRCSLFPEKPWSLCRRKTVS